MANKLYGDMTGGPKEYGAHISQAYGAYLTNKSGGSVVTGDVVVLDVTADNSFTTTTTAGDLRPVGVVMPSITADNISGTQTIANNADGWVFFPTMEVKTAAVDAAVTRGHYLKHSTTAKKLTTTGTQIGAAIIPPIGSSAVALETIVAAGSIRVLQMQPVAVQDRVAVLEDQKTAGTDGGTFTAGAWRTRTLNTEASDSTGIVTIAANQFTPIAGTYYLTAEAPAFAAGVHQARIYNATAASVTLVGQNAIAAAGGSGGELALVRGIFTANGTAAYELQHQCQTTSATVGLGYGANSLFAVTREVYAVVTLVKLSV